MTSRPSPGAVLPVALTVLLCVSPARAYGQEPPSVFLEELTWTEVRAAVDAGYTTVVIPTAGHEQNGPHMVLGKHHYIVDRTSGLIAEALGRTLVAPTVTYVPEGRIDPPSGHMRYAGTITLPNDVFMQVVEHGARSLAVHGFTDIVLIGDSGGNQDGMRQVSEKLNAEWAGAGVRVHFVGDYYADNGFEDWVVAQGLPRDALGSHAGTLDTAQLMAVAPRHVRDGARAPGGGFEGSGVSGDPTLATAELGRKGIELKVEAAVKQIRDLMNREGGAP
jgi:creatinine amidohydrolase/Fe(II)-dependent formamide hydrolase-like protein